MKSPNAAEQSYIRPSIPIQIQLKSNRVCMKRPAAAQKMAEMKNPILDYTAPSCGSWIKKQTKSNSRELLFPAKISTFVLWLNKDKTQRKTLSLVCFLNNLCLLDSIKTENKKSVAVQYFSRTFHKYSIYINIDRNTQYKPFVPCKNLKFYHFMSKNDLFLL